MKIDIQVQKQLKIIIAVFVFIAAIPPILTGFDVLAGITVLIWTVFLLGFVAILLLLGTFWLSKVKLLHLYLLTGGYWSAILLLVVFIGGMETHQTLHLGHAKDISLQKDLDEVFHYFLAKEKSRKAPASLISFEKIESANEPDAKSGTQVLFHTRYDISDSRLDEMLDQIVNSDREKSADVKLLIMEGDDPRMYEYSGLKPGDSIKVELNWKQRELQRSESAALMLGSRDCNLRIPLTIKNKRIQVPIRKDEKLTKEKLGVDLKELSEEELKIAQELFMVAHKIDFSEIKDSLLFNNLQYDGAGALILITSTLKEGEQLASDCDNRNNYMTELAVSGNDPYLTRLLFPYLQMHLESWDLEKRTAFVGVTEMFRQFPEKLEKAFAL